MTTKTKMSPVHNCRLIPLWVIHDPIDLYFHVVEVERYRYNSSEKIIPIIYTIPVVDTHPHYLLNPHHNHPQFPI